MTDRRLVTPAPAPLERYAQQFDPLFGKLNQRNGFRRSLEGLLITNLAPPPSPLQHLFDWPGQGRALFLYEPP